MRFVSLASLAVLSCAVGAAAQTAPQTSNFASVGFDVAVGDHDAFQGSVLDLAKDCAPIRLDKDDVVCLKQKDNGGQMLAKVPSPCACRGWNTILHGNRLNTAWR